MRLLMWMHPHCPSLRVHGVSGSASMSLLLKQSGTHVWRRRGRKSLAGPCAWLVDEHYKDSGLRQLWAWLAHSSLWDNEWVAFCETECRHSELWTQRHLDIALYTYYLISQNVLSLSSRGPKRNLLLHECGR